VWNSPAGQAPRARRGSLPLPWCPASHCTPAGYTLIEAHAPWSKQVHLGGPGYTQPAPPNFLSISLSLLSPSSSPLLSLSLSLSRFGKPLKPDATSSNPWVFGVSCTFLRSRAQPVPLVCMPCWPVTSCKGRSHRGSCPCALTSCTFGKITLDGGACTCSLHDAF